MNSFEMMSLAKVVSKAFDNNFTVSESELEMATLILKKFADNSPNWNSCQKELYKAMIDIIKETLMLMVHKLQKRKYKQYHQF